MLNSVLGAISAGVAIDLGTANTRVHVAGRGVIIDTPTVVAIHEDRSGRRRVLATGRDAAQMTGRAPADVRVVRPVRDGTIVDFEVLEAFLRLLMLHIHRRRLWVGPRVAVAVPHLLSDMEGRGVRETFEAAGAREVLLVERPLAAAVGVGLPIEDACGHMVIDVGAGHSSVSVLSLGEIVDWRQLPVGGDSVDAAIIARLQHEHGLLVSGASAEAARLAVGSALPDDLGHTWVRGRHLPTGWPRALSVDTTDLRGPIQDLVRRLADAALESLERVPPDLAADIAETGIVLAGGMARLHGLDVALGEFTGLPVVVPEAASHVVVSGCAERLTAGGPSRIAI
jgi:rod shape-determining protein MreB